MEREFVLSLVKFMSKLEMKTLIKVDRTGVDTKGRKFVCIEVRVEYKETVQYEIYHCYVFKHGQVQYAEGNETKGLLGSVLSFLGDNSKVYQYFEKLAKTKAKEVFEK